MSWSARLKTPTKPAPPAPKTPVTPRRAQDENARPDSAAKQKSACGALTKRFKDDKPAEPSTTPLQPSNRCRTPGLGRKTPTKKTATPAKTAGNVTPKKAQPKTTPTKIERSASRSVLVEFSDEILTTPGRRLLSDRGTPTLSVKTSSTVSIRHEPPASPPSLNRSKSAGSLSVRTSDDPIWRSRSEAKLFPPGGGPAPGGETSRVIVGARVRPPDPREPGDAVIVADNELRVASDLGSVHRFTFDRCFPAGTTTQEDVYEALVRPLVDTAFEGFNACLFAYGQTGSGKTYSMMGPMHAAEQLTPESGIIPRFCREVLDRVAELDASSAQEPNVVSSTVEISYLEVYNEKIHDLLVPGSSQLKVREHPVYGPYVADLTKHTTSNFDELQRWINVGNQKRATAATEMNDKSSRSHSLFTVILTQTFAQVGSDGSWSHDQTRRSRINLVDLAGSERIAHTSVTSDRLREGVSINKSLLTLGKVMTALVEKRAHVPYRDSVLTWLLKESLGGNSRTAMLATVSPSAAQIDETLSTLRYASQARSIVNTVRVNEEPQDKLIRELRAEIDRLRETGADGERIARPLTTDDSRQLQRLREDLDRKSWDLSETEKRLAAAVSEKENLRVKLAEYKETNRQLATKCADGKADVPERESLVDELLSLREQHDSLKKHYLSLQDELEYEKGSKYQLMSEKGSDAGLIASLTTKVDRLESQLLSEKNEVALRDSALAKLREELSEMQQAQDNLATTFLLKEEFCNAQALADVERNERIAEKQREVDELKSQLGKWTREMGNFARELCEIEITDDEAAATVVDSERLAALCARIKDQLTREKLDCRKLIAAERDVADNIRQREQRWIVEYEELLRSKNRFEDERNRLEETVKELETARNKAEAERDKIRDELKSTISGVSGEKKWEDKPTDNQPLQELVSELNERIENLTKENREFSAERESLRFEIERLKSAESELSKAKEELTKFKANHHLKSERTDEETEKLKRILSQKTAKLQYTEERLEKIKRETDELREASGELRGKYSSAETELKQLKQENGELEKEIGRLRTGNQDERRILREQIAELELKRSTAEDESREIKEENDELRKIHGEQEEKIKKENEELRKLKKENEELRKMEKENKELRKINGEQEEKMKEENEELRKMKKENEELRKINGEQEEKIKKENEELRKMKKENEELTVLNAQLRKEQDSKPDDACSLRQEMIDSRHRHEEEMRKIEGILSEKSSKLRYTEERLEKTKEELDGLRETNAELRLKLSTAEEELVKMKKAKEESARIRAQLLEEKDSWSSARSEEVEKLRLEVQGLQERNRLLKRRARKSKSTAAGADESKKLKSEIAQLKKLNKSVVAEVEKVGKLARTETIDGLLQKAKEELTSAAGEIKVLKSENATLSKRASKATAENESLREQMSRLDKERADLVERIDRMAGEKSVSEYKLRMSLVATKSAEDTEERLTRIRDRCEELKETCAAHVARIADLEHRLNLSQVGEANSKADLDSKEKQIRELKKELDAARAMQRELMDEKLTLVKVMEKRFDGGPEGGSSEAAALKKRLELADQRLAQKTERIATLGARAGQLESLLVKVVDGTIRDRLALEDLRSAIVAKDYSAFDLLAGLYLPHHLEYLVRKARTVAENHRIPYDIDYSASDSRIVFRHLVLTASAVLNRTVLDRWLANIEEKRTWSPLDDAELPWKVDMEPFVSRYPAAEPQTNAEPSAGSSSHSSAQSSALTLGVVKRKDGSLDPVEWRRTLIQRHVRGMKDDYSVLIKYFAEQDDSAVYAILERIRASVDRLEQVTSNADSAAAEVPAS